MKFPIRFFILQILFSDYSIEQNNPNDNVISNEENITKLILNKNYNIDRRPKEENEIYVDLVLKQLMKADEKTQTIVTNSYLYLWWNDSRLMWDSSYFDEIKRVPG